MTTPRYDARTQPLAPSSLTVVGEAERNYVAKVLSEAFAADRLTVEELDDRLTRLYQATNSQQLGPLLADPREPTRSLAQPESVSHIAHDFAVPERGVGAAIMGGFQRGEGWVLPRHFKAVAIMGGIALDLRDARIAPGVSEIEVFTLMGGVEVLVPDGVRVEVVGMAVMGGFDVRSGTSSLDDPQAPLLRISGLAIMGGVEVKRKDKGRVNQKRYEQALRRAEKAAKKLG
ncbi:MAG: DUF1707 and DUF2154 domain-containing protein [Gemmatimonadaceae bacterium]|nr:DUF1707 and DUF2154 domain-containing protein [Gemmatimonadaceae bacterium]